MATTLHEWLDEGHGRAQKLAAFLDVSKAAVSIWRDNGVPLPHMPRVVEFTEGAVSIERMVEHANACRTLNATKRAEAA
jgi:hypothetical protein